MMVEAPTCAREEERPSLSQDDPLLAGWLRAPALRRPFSSRPPPGDVVSPRDALGDDLADAWFV
jgi:hypothetical protein